METVYAFTYHPCIYENDPWTMSLHRTKEGAKKAMKKHQAAERRTWRNMYPLQSDRDGMPFGQFERWDVEPMTVLL